MASEDIERLKEKIAKDPNSKLFVPLAEEYKKTGMFDEATDVLIKGLERQPSYLSARVSLGKIYSERGMLNEAKDEFEKVISSIPDNLYAHKKLAEIYRDLGKKDKAVEEFKAVLKLNPIDDWAATSLAEIEKPEINIEEQTIEKIEEDILEEGIPVEEEVVEETEELAEVSLSKAEDIDLLESAPEEVEKVVEEQEDISDIFTADEEIEVVESYPEPDKKEETEETFFDIPVTEEDLKSVQTSEATEEVQESLSDSPVEIEEISEEEISFEGLEEEAEIAAEESEEAVSTLNLNDADQYIIRGNYPEAMNVYKKLLSIEPENKHILQRVEELKTLLKLLGKDKEELLGQLEKFLDGIKRRRNEFFGSS